jgi:hypothetical protein
MTTTTFKLYGYRWIVLAGLMLAVAFNQLLWITFAPITGPAAAFYGVSDLSIGLLSMSFMIAYLFVALPASWVIDTDGFRTAVGIGIGQPFILNAVTKVAARWFPLGERATASGLGSLATYLGDSGRPWRSRRF